MSFVLTFLPRSSLYLLVAHGAVFVWRLLGQKHPSYRLRERLWLLWLFSLLLLRWYQRRVCVSMVFNIKRLLDVVGLRDRGVLDHGQLATIGLLSALVC